MKFKTKTVVMTAICVTVLLAMGAAAVGVYAATGQANGNTPDNGEHIIAAGNSYAFVPSFTPVWQTTPQDIERFEIYSEFGLVYNPITNRLYFNGEIVRFFYDAIPLPGHHAASFGIKHLFDVDNGTVDVRAVRDFSQMNIGQGTVDFSLGLLGVEPFTREEFDAREIVLREDVMLEIAPPRGQIIAWIGSASSAMIGNSGTLVMHGNAAVYNQNERAFTFEAGLVTNQNYSTPTQSENFAETLAALEELGVTFYGVWATEDGRMAMRSGFNVFYHGQLARGFFDRGGHISFSSTDRSGHINVYTVRDDYGNLVGVEVIEL